MTTFTARYIFPVRNPPLERGTITIDGERIVAVEPHGVRTADIDLGNVAIIPGLVNAHTHLDLSGARGKIPPTGPEHFCDWLMGVINFRRTRTPQQTQSDIHDGLNESLSYGVTVLGDISAHGNSCEILSSSPLRSRLSWEIIGNAQRASGDLEYYRRTMTDQHQHDIFHHETSPHSPYSCDHDIAMRLLTNDGATIHLAESPGEIELLRDLRGPFVDFLKYLKAWDRSIYRYQAQEFVNIQCTKPRRQTYIHCNYLDHNTSFASHQSLIVCPRTHAAFRHPPHPFPAFLQRGATVALGTDSLASSPDLDLLAEAREAHRQYPQVPGEVILRMATINGAKALGFDSVCGTLEPGKSADFVAVPLKNVERADPHDCLFDFAQGRRRTLFRGVWRG